MSALYVISLLTAAGLAGLGMIAWKLRTALRANEIGSDWWESFSPEKYRLLPQLLGSGESEYLRTQPGCDRRLLSRFRAERARICLAFLREMKGDFERLQAVGQALVVANRGSADLPDELFRQRVRFSWQWWRARAGVLAWRFGLPEPDMAALVQVMQASASRVRLAVSPAA